jgi:type IV secretory pathway TrbD component
LQILQFMQLKCLRGVVAAVVATTQVLVVAVVRQTEQCWLPLLLHLLLWLVAVAIHALQAQAPAQRRLEVAVYAETLVLVATGEDILEYSSLQRPRVMHD